MLERGEIAPSMDLLRRIAECLRDAGQPLSLPLDEALGVSSSTHTAA